MSRLRLLDGYGHARPDGPAAPAESDRGYRILVEHLPGIVYTAHVGEHGTWEFVSPQVEAILGYTVDEWLATSSLWFDRIHPSDRERVMEDEERLGDGGRLRSEYRMYARDGTLVWLSDEATRIRGEDGIERFQGVMIDITAQKSAQEALAASEVKYRHLVETSEDLIWALDADTRFTFLNPAVEHIFGYEAKEMLGRPFTDFVDPRQAALDLDEFARTLAGGAAVRYETTHLRKDGQPVMLSVNAVPLRDSDGNTIGITGTARDVTAARTSAAAVAEKHGQLQAIIDNSPLMIFAKDRQHRFLLANREFEGLFGLRPGEIVGRNEADVLPPHDAERFYEADERVMATGARVETEELAGGSRTLMLHKFPLRDADGRIYGMCGIGSDITERKAREDALRAKVEWSFRIREAIASDRLALHSQPIVELATGKVVQEELLVRMLGEGGELVMPGEFLPPAERFGLAPAIDRWVISQAVRLAGTRRVEVNLSAKSMADPLLPDFIEAELTAAGADPSHVVFEITETAAAEDIDQARRLAERLTGLGCGFALDDFGTGYGSFTYLKHLPVSYIKIDIDFVRDLVEDPSNRQVVSAIVDVARNFGIRTIAEGVESQLALQLLDGLGVDLVQGYHLGRPSPVELPARSA